MTLPAFIDRTFFALNAQAENSATQIVTGRDGPSSWSCSKPAATTG